MQSDHATFAVVNASMYEQKLWLIGTMAALSLHVSSKCF